MWFSYNGEGGFETHNTEKEAKDAAAFWLDDAASNAQDGWSEDSLSICWGKVIQHVGVTSQRPRTSDDFVDPDIDMIEERELLPTEDYRELMRRAMAIIGHAIMCGMPITQEVADVRNELVKVMAPPPAKA